MSRVERKRARGAARGERKKAERERRKTEKVGKHTRARAEQVVRATMDRGVLADLAKHPNKHVRRAVKRRVCLLDALDVREAAASYEHAGQTGTTRMVMEAVSPSGDAEFIAAGDGEDEDGTEDE